MRSWSAPGAAWLLGLGHLSSSGWALVILVHGRESVLREDGAHPDGPRASRNRHGTLRLRAPPWLRGLRGLDALDAAPAPVGLGLRPGPARGHRARDPNGARGSHAPRGAPRLCRLRGSRSLPLDPGRLVAGRSASMRGSACSTTCVNQGLASDRPICYRDSMSLQLF